MATERRPRIDGIVNAIENGQYDDQLTVLQAALNARRKQRQDEVLALVQEVYGEDAQITLARKGFSQDVQTSQSSTPPGMLGPYRNGAQPLAEAPENPVQVIEEPEVVEMPHEEAGPLTQDYESRSPLIGSLDDLQGGEQSV